MEVTDFTHLLLKQRRALFHYAKYGTLIKKVTAECRDETRGREFIKALAFISIFLIFAAGKAAAQNHGNISPSQVKSVRVKLLDDAVDACWTNLSESRSYAEEKLRMAGYNVIPREEDADWLFGVVVTAFRSELGNCIGSIDVTLTRMFFREAGGVMVMQAAKHGTTVISNSGENINKTVIQNIQEMVNDL